MPRLDMNLNVKKEECSIDKYKPHYKKKGKCTNSFRIIRKCDSVFKYISPHHISMTTIRNEDRLDIQTIEDIHLLNNKKIASITIKRLANKYYAYITYEKTNHKKSANKNTKIGIDLGIKRIATTYDGNNVKCYELPNNLLKAEEKRKLISRRLSRTIKDSNNHKKLLLRLEKAYIRENNIKKDYREKNTTYMASNYETINIDMFNIGTIFTNLKGKGVHRQASRVGAYEFALHLKQKVEERNGIFNEIQFKPTSKTCSCCGNIKDNLDLNMRTYTCDMCGNIMDRDENASINVYKII